MIDYSQPLIALEKQIKRIHECFLHGNIEQALNMTDDMQLSVLELRQYCFENLTAKPTSGI